MAIRKVVLVAAVCGLGMAQPAGAQALYDTIAQIAMNSGAQAYTACMSGQGVPQKKLDAALEPAKAMMKSYFTAAAAGSTRVPYFRVDKHSLWATSAASLDRNNLDSQPDPLAQPGNRLDPVPVRFYRAANLQTAEGQWLVRDSGGDVVGLYTALLKREDGEWKLYQLHIATADEPVSPITQYCSDPGDVLPYKLRTSASMIGYANKSLAKARDRLAKQDARVRRAEADLAAHPDSERRKSALEREQQRADGKAQKVQKLEKDLADERDRQSKAKAEQASLAALAGPARLADRFRITDKSPKG